MLEREAAVLEFLKSEAYLQKSCSPYGSSYDIITGKAGLLTFQQVKVSVL